MSFNGSNVIFLEMEDFKNNKLHYKGAPVKGKWVVMVHGSYCTYCLQSMPIFASLSETHGSMELDKGTIFATIQIDGSESEKTLGKNLPKITEANLTGVPVYLLFENGKFSAMLTGGQGKKELIEFIN